MDADEKLNISDLAGLSQPLTKLIETISCGIGRIFEPWHIKRMAKARAEELELISATVNKALQLPITYDSSGITINTTDANNLVQRAQNRFLFQEMKKQQNIEAVIDFAYSELENVESVSNTPVDSDWISAFFDSVTNVSTEQMQKLWGKLLSGEIQHPGSFSLRTLNVLKNLTQTEAVFFQQIVPFVLRCPGNTEKTFEDYFLLEGYGVDGKGILGPCGIPFVKIMQLSEAGILSENSQISIVFDVAPASVEYIKGKCKAIKVENQSTNGHILSIRHGAYFFTAAGKELLPILLENSSAGNSDEYIVKCLAEIRRDGIFFPESPIAPDEYSIEIVDLL